VKEKVNGNVSLSPKGKYAYWFDRMTQHYYTVDLSNSQITEASKGISTQLGDELNDQPTSAGNYGIVGWTENDANLLIYDRYDIWKIDPLGKTKPINLTKGRNKKLVSRYIELNREADFLDLSKRLLLSIFDEKDKSSGYAYLNPDQSIDQKMLEPFSYGRRVIKAKNADVLVFTKESMELFPDLLWSSAALDNQTKISNANPQQSEYLWGTGKLYAWKDDYGNDMSGMLYTPENFDPTKKYPLIINFYERSSDGLYRHRAPYAGRSTISYSYYLSQGYVIFNPDIPYQIGYPGKSALNAVMSGLDALITEGFVDEKHVGIQGHSWGGYQIAHILTKTDRFTCAEAGAPVVNMTSAYGGIRWGSGMSRMFQYERTQSRLGNTLWERPDLYLENSPLFETDKVETPVLILHNDNDGAVPWYQGIEYYMALRRLGKKGWLLNYNGEPHWPVKWPNRLDFQTRMEQFFAHYLLDKPMPEWMEKGVSELEKGKKLGY
jgi:dipeptidyl aminopeptidase/acylaminoacyl peptidase